MSEELPKTMYTDENRLQQILKNLLSNAFKFTEKGQVTLEIALADKSRHFPVDTLNKAKSAIIFRVTDTGIGIPLEKQKLIFEAFQQADGTTSRKYGGTGLGLTISREIARLLGGIIEVESQPGHGSVFTLFLPQKYTGTEAANGITNALATLEATSYSLPVDADFTGRRILVIDDDVRNVFALTSILKNRGIEVIYAENGRHGVDVLIDNPETDLVLMDTMMPEMDGLAATQKIRQIEKFKDLPIISLTAKAMKGDREKCLEAGASDYVTKPVDESHLLAVIYKWLNPKEI